MVEGTICVVIGGGNGLGEAAAHELADHGATVVVADRGTSVAGEGNDPAVPEQVAADIRESGGEATAHHVDVREFDDAERLVAETVAEHGRLDFVANFAGILRDGMSYKLDPEDWEAVVETNLTGQFAPLREACAHWREASDDDGFDRQRSYLAVSAGAARGNLGQANYAAAKAGVLGMVRSVSTELHRSNVRVNALIPNGYTRMTETVPEEHRPYTREEMPPEKVAPMVAYLASEAAEDVTGCTLYAGGDRVGVLSDPSMAAVGVEPDGWSLDSLAEHFADDVAADVELTRTDAHF
ncbi:MULTISPECIES: SDR family oxidoreductase [Halorubrum]|uniref:Dehydrogenase n=1 Tax=Halorubrum tropicale TaxID=1765655 RepID=A0A0M9AN58_9EURY|nr:MULTISPECIES: SDR family oxidoreductase [Halorubrum]KOX95439.1 dehydrogenase [Halorubrum tropicale]MDB2239008.1 SDR family oxidoreductase [Halorubrum ezzemoulense]MDB2249745.1 SDR family oxidoreductase [Halorubrum ezzemoulense]